MFNNAISYFKQTFSRSQTPTLRVDHPVAAATSLLVSKTPQMQVEASPKPDVVVPTPIKNEVNRFESTFKSDHSFEKRIKRSYNITQKYPTRIPIIVNTPFSSSAPKLEKTQYLVPQDFTVSQFMFEIRKRLKLSPEQAVFLFTEYDGIPPANEMMSALYKRMGNLASTKSQGNDGFLYLFYEIENTFGSAPPWPRSGLADKICKPGSKAAGYLR